MLAKRTPTRKTSTSAARLKVLPTQAQHRRDNDPPQLALHATRGCLRGGGLPSDLAVSNHVQRLMVTTMKMLPTTKRLAQSNAVVADALDFTQSLTTKAPPSRSLQLPVT